MKRGREASLQRRPSVEEFGGVLHGTVGWQDGGDHYDKTPDPQTGVVVTLVKVTLFEGYNADLSGPLPDDGRAHGHQILAQISAPMFDIPADGTVVHVSIPARCLRVPGAPVIIAQVKPTPANQQSASKSKLDFGPDTDLVIKARSITLTDYEDRYIVLGPKYGFKVGDADVNGCQMKDAKWAFWTSDEDGVAKTAFQLSETGGIKLLIDDGKTVGMVMRGGKWSGVGEKFEANFGAGALGKFTGIETAVTHAIAYSAAGPANAVSPNWIISSA